MNLNFCFPIPRSLQRGSYNCNTLLCKRDWIATKQNSLSHLFKPYQIWIKSHTTFLGLCRRLDTREGGTPKQKLRRRSSKILKKSSKEVPKSGFAGLAWNVFHKFKSKTHYQLSNFFGSIRYPKRYWKLSLWGPFAAEDSKSYQKPRF